MIRRATIADYEAIKELMNDPHIRKGMSDETSELDPFDYLQEPRNVILFDGRNCLLFLWRWVGIYEAHILYRDRGAKALRLAREMLDLMTGSLILAVINYRLPHAAWFVRRLGFQSRGLVNTIEGPSEMFQMELR